MKIWHALLKEDIWRAYVINTENGVVMARGPFSPSATESVVSLKLMLHTEVLKKASSGDV